MLSKTDELRIVVIGRTGSGMSSIANAILRVKHFDSKISLRSVTQVAERAKIVKGGLNMIVVDTPGMFNTEIPNAEVKAQLKKSIEMVAPGPHLFLYVFQLGRQTDEEEETIKEMIDIFGNAFFKHTVIVFTGAGYIDVTSIKYYIEEMPDFVKNLLEQCSFRYVTLKYQTNDTRNEMSLQKVFEFQNDEYFKKGMLIQSNKKIRRKVEAVKYAFGKMSYSATEKIKSVASWLKSTSLFVRVFCCGGLVFILTIALVRSFR